LTFLLVSSIFNFGDQFSFCLQFITPPLASMTISPLSLPLLSLSLSSPLSLSLLSSISLSPLSLHHLSSLSLSSYSEPFYPFLPAAVIFSLQSCFLLFEPFYSITERAWRSLY
jgi:hypothetical protein